MKKVFFFLLISITSQIGCMKQTPVNISEPVKNQLIQLLKNELTNTPEDLSRKSDHKLKQIIEICTTLLYRDDARANFAKLLNVNDYQLKTLLTRLDQRAQAALSFNKPKEIVAPPPRPEIKKIETPPAPSMPLWQAANEGNLAVVEWHLTHGTNVNSKSPGDETPLALAANKGQQEIVTRLIKAGADVNIANRNGHTPLIIAAMHGYEDIVKDLLAAGANISDVPAARNLAVQQGHKGIKKLLDQAEGRFDYTKPIDPKNRFVKIKGRWTPGLSIWQASAQGDWPIIEWHLNHGATINAADKYGETPLKLAAENNHHAIVARLQQRSDRGSIAKFFKKYF